MLARLSAVAAITVVALGLGCAPESMPGTAPIAVVGGQALEPHVIAVSPTRVALRVEQHTVATIDVDHVSLDRVDAHWHPRHGSAVVVHHGRHGGATLLHAQGARTEKLMVTGPEVDLSAPRWSAGGTIAVVRQLAATLQGGGPTARVRFAGQLWLVSPADGARPIAALADASRVLGWVNEQSLLVTRYDDGDLPREHLARLDLTTGTVVQLLGADGAGTVLGITLLGDRIGYVRADEPIGTLPAPHQRLVVRLANLDGEAVGPLIEERGALPVRLSRDGAQLRYDLDGSRQQRMVDLFDGSQREQLRRIEHVPPPPRLLDLSTLSMPFVHQVYDTPNDFNGHWACGPTAALMAILHFGRLPKWTHTVSVPSPHPSDYGAYVAYKYTSHGHTFDRVQNDAGGKPAQGGYGWCTEGGAAWAWRMQDYAKKHDLKSDFSGSASFAKVKAELDAGKVVALSTQLTSAGHIITVRGTTADGKIITNDPYGDRNLPSYPNTKGEQATYAWSMLGAKWYITVYGTPTVQVPPYKAKVVDVNYPPTMAAGATASAAIKVRNEGSASWNDQTRLGTTEPRDRASGFHTAGDWLSATRAAATDIPAQPGETATFSFTLTAPDSCTEVEHVEHFNLVQEGTAWFSDATQGGPDDRALALTIKVTPRDADGDGAAAGSCGDCDDADPAVHPAATELCNGKDDNCDGQVDEGCATAPDAGVAAPDAGVADGAVIPPGLQPPLRTMQGGCAVAGSRPHESAPWLLLVVLLAGCRRCRTCRSRVRD